MNLKHLKKIKLINLEANILIQLLTITNHMKHVFNTPGTRGWSRLRDRTLVVAKNRAKMTFFLGEKKLPKKNIFFLHISSSYAKILGETNFHAREIPRSGSTAEDGERKRERKTERW